MYGTPPAAKNSPNRTHHPVRSNSRGKPDGFFSKLRSKASKKSLNNSDHVKATEANDMASAVERKKRSELPPTANDNSRSGNGESLKISHQSVTSLTSILAPGRAKVGGSEGEHRQIKAKGWPALGESMPSLLLISPSVSRAASLGTPGPKLAAPVATKKPRMVARGAKERQDTVTAIEMIRGLDEEAKRQGIGEAPPGPLLSYMDFDDEDVTVDYEDIEVSPVRSRLHKQHKKHKRHNAHSPAQQSPLQGIVQGKEVPSTNNRNGSKESGNAREPHVEEKRLDAVPGHVTVFGPDGKSTNMQSLHSESETCADAYALRYAGEYWCFGPGAATECECDADFQRLSKERRLGGEEAAKLGKARANKIYEWCGHYHFAEMNDSGNVESDMDEMAKHGFSQWKQRLEWLKKLVLVKRMSDDTDDTGPTMATPSTATLPNSFSDQSLPSPGTVNNQLLPDMVRERNHGDRLSAMWDPNCAPDSTLAKGASGAFDTVPRTALRSAKSKFDLGALLMTALGASFTRLKGIKDPEVEISPNDEGLSPFVTWPSKKHIEATMAGHSEEKGLQMEGKRVVTRDIEVPAYGDEDEAASSPISPVTPWVQQQAKMVPKESVTRMRRPSVPETPTRTMRRTKSDQSMRTTASNYSVAPPIPPPTWLPWRVESTVPDTVHDTYVSRVITSKMPSSPEEEGWKEALQWAKRSLKEAKAREKAAQKAKEAEDRLDPKAVEKAEFRAKVKAGKKLIQSTSKTGWTPKKPVYEMTHDEFEAYSLAVAELNRKDREGLAMKKYFKFVGPKKAMENFAKRPQTPLPGDQVPEDEPPPPLPTKSIRRRSRCNAQAAASHENGAKATRVEDASSAHKTHEDISVNAATHTASDVLVEPVERALATAETEGGGPTLAPHDTFVHRGETSADEHRRETLRMLEAVQEGEISSHDASIANKVVGLGITSDAASQTASFHDEEPVTLSENHVKAVDDSFVYSQDIDGKPSVLDEPALKVSRSSRLLGHLAPGSFNPRRNSSFVRRINQLSQQRAMRLVAATSHPALRTDNAPAPPVVSTAPPVPFNPRNWGQVLPLSVRRPGVQDAASVPPPQQSSTFMQPAPLHHSRTLPNLSLAADDVFAVQTAIESPADKGNEGVVDAYNPEPVIQHDLQHVGEEDINRIVEIDDEDALRTAPIDKGQFHDFDNERRNSAAEEDTNSIVEIDDEDAFRTAPVNQGQFHDFDTERRNSSDSNSFYGTPAFRAAFADTDGWFQNNDAAEAEEEDGVATRESSIYEAAPIDDENYSHRSISTTAIDDEYEDIVPLHLRLPHPSNILAENRPPAVFEREDVHRLSGPALHINIDIDIDDVIEVWNQRSPGEVMATNTAKPEDADCPKIQEARLEVGLPQLKERAESDARKHPEHPYDFHTEKMMCYAAHNSPHGSPLKMKQCKSCREFCCRYAKSIVTGIIQSTDASEDFVRLRARARIDFLRSHFPNGVEEYDTFLTCGECSKLVCPACAIVCEHPMCKQIVCKDHGEDGLCLLH